MYFLRTDQLDLNNETSSTTQITTEYSRLLIYSYLPELLVTPRYISGTLSLNLNFKI